MAMGEREELSVITGVLLQQEGCVPIKVETNQIIDAECESCQVE